MTVYQIDRASKTIYYTGTVFMHPDLKLEAEINIRADNQEIVRQLIFLELLRLGIQDWEETYYGGIAPVGCDIGDHIYARAWPEAHVELGDYVIVTSGSDGLAIYGFDKTLYVEKGQPVGHIRASETISEIWSPGGSDLWHRTGICVFCQQPLVEDDTTMIGKIEYEGKDRHLYPAHEACVEQHKKESK